MDRQKLGKNKAKNFSLVPGLLEARCRGREKCF